MAKPQKELYEQLHWYSEFVHRLMPRWWIIFVATVLGGGLSVGLALVLPRKYESRAMLHWQEGVDKRRFLSRHEAGAADWTWLKGRLASLVSSDTRLLGMIRDFDLYPSARRSEPQATLLDRMRKDIRYDSLGGTTFWIAYEYSDRYRAQQVTARLVRDFIKQSADDAVGTAVATRDFMESEALKARAQVDAIEDDIASFVSRHPEFQTDPSTGMLRGGRGGGRSAPSNVAALLARADTPELRSALLEKGRLEAQLRLAEGARPDASAGQLRQELTAAQRTLILKRQRYTDEHPDVQRTRAYVVQLQGQLRSAEEGRRTSSAAAERLREQLARVDSQIAELSRPRHAAKVAAKPAPRSLLSVPAQAEKRWYELTRNRTIQKAKYDQLQEQLLKARMGADLEKQGAMSQIEIVDPANLPYAPLKPSRTKIAMAGTILGFLIGLGLAGLLVLLDPRVYNRDDLRRASDIPVLALVPSDA